LFASVLSVAQVTGRELLGNDWEAFNPQLDQKERKEGLVKRTGLVRQRERGAECFSP
jgi:hypothetical protein